MSHTGFPLVPKSVTLNDLERRNGRYFVSFYRFGSFGTNCVKVVEVRPTIPLQKCSSKNLFFVTVIMVILRNGALKTDSSLESEHSTCATLRGHLRST